MIQVVNYLQLFRNATSYIRDGRLVKYRHTADNPEAIDSRLSLKAENNNVLTPEELAYVMARGGLVIERKGRCTLYGVTVAPYIEDSP